ncbi:DUF6745 domain-containing protein [Nonomuraea sp. NPDC052634]|uniref:DUF6745 domain-containing protein n=1 Tax=Nonomuraea sp. NPDC052634 TaxID=3155813 RepID=UPI003444B670
MATPTWEQVALATGPGEGAEAAVRQAYKEAGLPEPELVLMLPSPAAGAVVAAWLTGDEQARAALAEAGLAPESPAGAFPAPELPGLLGDAGPGRSVRDDLRTKPWERARAAAYAELGPVGWAEHWAETGGRLWPQVERLISDLRRAIGRLGDDPSGSVGERGAPQETPSDRSRGGRDVGAVLREATLDAVLGQHDAPWLFTFDALDAIRYGLAAPDGSAGKGSRDGLAGLAGLARPGDPSEGDGFGGPGARDSRDGGEGLAGRDGLSRLGGRDERGGPSEPGPGAGEGRDGSDGLDERGGPAGLDDIPDLDGLMRVAEQAGWWWPYERVAIVTERPVELHLDDLGRLHRADGPAMAYADGFALHAWHGMPVPAGFGAVMSDLTVERIRAERNAELRRVMLEHFGFERYLAESDAKRIHSDETGTLWRVDLPGDEPLTMVEVVNSTPEPDGTRRTYFLRVPPWIQRAKQGVAWTFGLAENEYDPQRET